MTGKVVVLTGGVGGAKAVLGLSRIMDPSALTAIVNVGDDFTHLGLRISPDIDTLLYTLADKGDLEKGWGRRNETWTFMAALEALGGEGWFALGDGDLALHVERTRRLAEGQALSAITTAFAKAWEIGATILPASDGPLATLIETDEGALPFQRYFVERRCHPIVKSIRFEGARTATPAPGVLEAIAAAATVIIAPSNPYLSIDPILAIEPITKALRTKREPVVAISPLIGGKAVKGPTAKLMVELGLTPGNAAIAKHYQGLVQALLIDQGDLGLDLGIPHSAAKILMTTLADRDHVARCALRMADELRRS